MSDNFLPYVPDYVARDILADPEAVGLGAARRFNAVTLFADVSGFTAISEALGKTGKIGTEELTQILNSYFEPMIQLIKTYGGIIGKFGGDAMTVMFPYDESTQAETVRRAIQCGLDMQRDMVNYEAIATSQGTFALAMKAGLGMGGIYTSIVGDPAVRLEFIIAGDPIDDCADAEHHATKGEVVVHDSLLPFAPDAEIVEPREGFSLIARLNEPVSRNPLTSPQNTGDAAAAVLRQFLPPIIAERVQSGNDDFIDEHRRTTVLFVSFTEQTYEDDAVGDVLQTYFQTIVNIVNRYDGYINKIDMGDKGSKYIILFGAPNAHENDEERALRCALEIADVHGIKTRIGVNTGSVYSGRVGSTIRREYTVMGDAVNLSARLMQFAKPGQIIVSGLTREHMAHNPFTWEELESIMVKGKSEPIEVARLLGVSAAQNIAVFEPEYALEMVGRAAELEQVRGLLEQAKGGQGQIIGIQGEAGMGKSRLAAEIIKQGRADGFTGIGGAAQSFNTTLAYTVWQGVWRGMFGIDPAESEANQIKALESALADINPDFLERLPLTGPLLGLDIPDNDLTETLDPAMRTDLLHTLLLDVLRARSESDPVLLVLEDLHWMDPASHALLAYLGRNIHDLAAMILTVFRPPHSSEGDSPVVVAVGELSNFTLMNLEAFDHAEAEQLIQMKLDQLFGGHHHVSDELTERIRQRSQGNPFYIEELINLLRDRNVDPTATDLQEFELPASLEQLILSRIDNLREDEKTVIKVASIIGRLFRASWVYGSYPEVGVPQFVIDRLDRLGDLELTPMDRPEPELEYLFRHLLTQEVAYGTMAFSVRADLHERVGDFVEQRYEDNLQRYVDVLAYHYGQSDNQDKQRIYFRMAGDNAKRTYVLQAGAYYYEQLLPLLAEDQQAEVLLALAEVQQILGSWEQAEANFRRVLELAQNDTPLVANARAGLGDLLSYMEGYEEALNLLGQAQATFESLKDNEGLNRVLKHLGYIYLRQGNYDQTRSTAERQIEIARTLDNRVTISEAQQNLAMADWYTGNLDAALGQFNEIVTSAEETGYKQGAIYALSNMAGIHYMRQNYPESVEMLHKALEIAQQIGYTRVIGGMIGNLGAIYNERGMFDEATACYLHALRVALELGDWHMVAFATAQLAEANRGAGMLAGSARLATRAIPLAEQMQAPFYLADALFVQSEVLLNNGNVADARAAAERALSTAQEVNNSDTAFNTDLLLVKIRQTQGELDRTATIAAYDALRESYPEETEQAALDYAIWQLDPENDAVRESATRRYQTLYEMAAKQQYRERYAELTGQNLPDPEPLPELPKAVRRGGAPLESLLALVDARLN